MVVRCGSRGGVLCSLWCKRVLGHVCLLSPQRQQPLRLTQFCTVLLAIGTGLFLGPMATTSSAAPAQGFVHVHALLVHPQHGTLLVGTHHGLFRSHDAGKTCPEVRALASVKIATGMGGIFLYAGTADGVFRSPD